MHRYEISWGIIWGEEKVRAHGEGGQAKLLESSLPLSLYHHMIFLYDHSSLLLNCNYDFNCVSAVHRSSILS